MNRARNILFALTVWAASSALLLSMCVFSVNHTIISAAIIFTALTLVGSALAFGLKHDKLGFGIAAGPALAIAGLLILFVIYGYTHYYR